MLKDVLKSVRRKAAFGVENAISAPGRFMDERKLKRLEKNQTNVLNKTGQTPYMQKSELKEIGKGMQEVSKRNKDRLTKLKAIDYYSK